MHEVGRGGIVGDMDFFLGFPRQLRCVANGSGDAIVRAPISH